MDTEERQHLEDLLQRHRRNLRDLEKRAVDYGSLAIPTELSNAIRNERADIEFIEKTLSPALEQILKPVIASRFQGLVNFVSIILIALSGFAGYYIRDRQLHVDTMRFSVSVAAFEHPFVNTNIMVQQGDDVEVLVQGDDVNWYCGGESTTAEGLIRQEPEGRVRIMPNGNLCELVGYLQENSLLRIGSYNRFRATTSGILFLGANDAATDYGDNRGRLSVQVTITR